MRDDGTTSGNGKCDREPDCVAMGQLQWCSYQGRGEQRSGSPQEGGWQRSGVGGCQRDKKGPGGGQP